MTNVDDIDLDLEGDNDPNESNGMKALRAALKKAQKEAAENASALATERAKTRTTDLAKFLEKFEAPAKVAKFAARDIEGDITEDTVKAWLEAEGDAFGWEPPTAESEEEAANQTAARRVATVTRLAPEAPSSTVTVDSLKGMSFADMEAQGLVQKFR